jgi:hypothetical protein
LVQVRVGGDVVVVGVDVEVDVCVVVVGFGVVVVGAAVVVDVVVGAAVVVGLGDGAGTVPPAPVNVPDRTRSRPSENLITAVTMCDPLARVDTSSGAAVPSALVPTRSKGAYCSVCSRELSLSGSRVNVTWLIAARPGLTKT